MPSRGQAEWHERNGHPLAETLLTPGNGWRGGMDVTKDYVDAQDERTRAQNDARFAEVLAGISKIEVRVEGLTASINEARSAAQRAETAAANIKWNTLFIGVSLFAIVVGVMSYWIQGIPFIADVLARGAS
jgi:hypothetical protein